MPIPDALLPFLEERRFWSDAYWATSSEEERYEALRDTVVRFPITDTHALTLTLDEWLCYFELGLEHDEAQAQLAWDDQAHWHPHLLRWYELDAIGRAIAERDASLPHPGVPLLLLARFAPVVDDAEAWEALRLLEAASKHVPAVDARVRATIFDHCDSRGSGMRWQRSPRGDELVQDPADRLRARPLYTLRNAEEETFPFEPFTSMLEAIGAHPSLDPAEPRALPVPRSWARFSIQHGADFPKPAAHFLAHFLDRALRDGNLGKASCVGSSVSGTGVPIESEFAAHVRAPDAEAMGRVAAYLRWAGVLEATTTWGGEPVEAPAREGTYLQVFGLRVARWTGGYRLDRAALDPRQRTAIAHVLDLHGFSPATTTGERTNAKLGARAVFDLDADTLDGGSFWLDTPTADALAVVLDVARETASFVYPPLCAPSSVAELGVEWPRAHVVRSPEELAERVAAHHASLDESV